MPIHVERSDRMITVIHSRPEVHNAVDSEHAEALYQAFLDRAWPPVFPENVFAR